MLRFTDEGELKREDADRNGRRARSRLGRQTNKQTKYIKGMNV